MSHEEYVRKLGASHNYYVWRAEASELSESLASRRFKKCSWVCTRHKNWMLNIRKTIRWIAFQFYIVYFKYTISAAPTVLKWFNFKCSFFLNSNPVECVSIWHQSFKVCHWISTLHPYASEPFSTKAYGVSKWFINRWVRKFKKCILSSHSYTKVPFILSWSTAISLNY